MLINIRESKLGSFDMSFYHENMGVSVFLKNLSVSDRKGLISRVAQWISPGIILILINHAPGYHNQQRKKLFPTKPGSLKYRALATGLIGLKWVSGEFSTLIR